MRHPRRSHRLTLAVVAATIAGLLTAWSEPARLEQHEMRRQIAQLSREAKRLVSPSTLTVVDQPLPNARTVASSSQ